MKEYFDILIEIGRTGILPKEDYLAEHSLKKGIFYLKVGSYWIMKI